MNAIWKYQHDIRDGDYATFSMPLNAKPVHIEADQGVVSIWARVDLDYTEPAYERYFRIAGTGHPVEDDARYIGTAIDGAFVWHTFEVQEVPA